MNVLNNDGLHIKNWAGNIEELAENQATNLSKLPFAFHHIALMPDAHSGYGMPIGGVMATKGVVVPNCVGVDIGCGVAACKLNIDTNHLNRTELQDIVDDIRKVVPVGFKKHSVGFNSGVDLPLDFFNNGIPEIISRNIDNAIISLGTLGGGNHFIELQKDQDGYLWIMIHSGSRNLGKVVAEHYNDIAKNMNNLWYSSVPENHDLAFLPISTFEGCDYLDAMNLCVQFAYANRKLMMDRCIGVIDDLLLYKAEVLQSYNVHHNYASKETHYGEEVIVHRKGATSAKLGEIGIIPGSQGTSSYIVRGLGNPESFMSCSHGAGRVLSRTKAKTNLDLEVQKAILDRKGILHNMNSISCLDEAPGAYKDIDEVMKNQSDLVEIVTKLEPLAVIKG